jgi:hypothetical protein
VAGVQDHRATSPKRRACSRKRRQRRLRDELRSIVMSALDPGPVSCAAATATTSSKSDVLDRRLDPWTAADELLQGVGA